MSASPGRGPAPPGAGALRVAGVLVAALAFRLYALQENMLYDPLAYAQYAYNLAEGAFTLTDDYAFAHRLTVIVPVAGLYGWLGVGPVSSHLWPLVASLAQVAAVIWLGTRLFDRSTGLLAGFLLAVAPLDVLAGSRLAPDAVMASFLTLAAACWVTGTDRAGRLRPVLCLLAGIAVALAVLTRMYAGLFVVFLIAVWHWRGLPLRAPLWALLGAAAVVLPLAWLYLDQTGSALHPLQVQAGSFGRQSDPHGPQPFFYFWHLSHPRSSAGLFGALSFVVVVAALLRPRPERVLLLLWILPFFLYLQFGSMSLARYEPVWKTLRYLTPLFAPVALLAATLALETVRGREFAWLGRLRVLGSQRARGLAATLLVVALTAQSFTIVHASRERDRRVTEAFRGAVAVLEREPELPVYFDHWRTGIAFAYYVRFREGSRFYHDAADSLRIGEPGSFPGSRFGYLPWFADPNAIPESFAVVHEGVLAPARAAGSPPARYLWVVVPRFAHEPPSAWRLAYEAQGLRVYRVPAPAAADSAAALERARASR